MLIYLNKVYIIYLDNLDCPIWHGRKQAKASAGPCRKKARPGKPRLAAYRFRSFTMPAILLIWLSDNSLRSLHNASTAAGLCSPASKKSLGDMPK